MRNKVSRTIKKYNIAQVIKRMLQITILKLLSKQQRQLETDNITISLKKNTTDSVKYSIKFVMKPRQHQPTYSEVIFNASCRKYQISKHIVDYEQNINEFSCTYEIFMKHMSQKFDKFLKKYHNHGIH